MALTLEVSIVPAWPSFSSKCFPLSSYAKS